jgi:hypothetical protein
MNSVSREYVSAYQLCAQAAAVIDPSSAFAGFEHFESSEMLHGEGKTIAVTAEMRAADAAQRAAREAAIISPAQAWRDKLALSVDNLRTVKRKVQPGRVDDGRQYAVPERLVGRLERFCSCGAVLHWSLRGDLCLNCRPTVSRHVPVTPKKCVGCPAELPVRSKLALCVDCRKPKPKRIVRDVPTATVMADALLHEERPRLPPAIPVLEMTREAGINVPKANQRGAKPKYLWTSEQDAMLRGLYERKGENQKFSVKAAAANATGYPDYICMQRGRYLGLARVKESVWSKEELDFLELHVGKHDVTIARVFRAAGFNRSAAAIHLAVTRKLGGVRSHRDFFSAGQLGQLMGVDMHAVTRWIEQGLLAGERRESMRTEKQGGKSWAITQGAVRAFLVENPLAFDIRKVNQGWFMELLTRANFGGSNAE